MQSQMRVPKPPAAAPLEANLLPANLPPAQLQVQQRQGQLSRPELRQPRPVRPSLRPAQPQNPTWDPRQRRRVEQPRRAGPAGMKISSATSNAMCLSRALTFLASPYRSFFRQLQGEEGFQSLFGRGAGSGCGCARGRLGSGGCLAIFRGRIHDGVLGWLGNCPPPPEQRLPAVSVILMASFLFTGPRA